MTYDDNRQSERVYDGKQKDFILSDFMARLLRTTLFYSCAPSCYFVYAAPKSLYSQIRVQSRSATRRAPSAGRGAGFVCLCVLTS